MWFWCPASQMMQSFHPKDNSMKRKSKVVFVLEQNKWLMMHLTEVTRKTHECLQSVLPLKGLEVPEKWALTQSNYDTFHWSGCLLQCESSHSILKVAHSPHLWASVHTSVKKDPNEYQDDTSSNEWLTIFVNTKSSNDTTAGFVVVALLPGLADVFVWEVLPVVSTSVK